MLLPEKNVDIGDIRTSLLPSMTLAHELRSLASVKGAFCEVVDLILVQHSMTVHLVSPSQAALETLVLRRMTESQELQSNLATEVSLLARVPDLAIRTGKTKILLMQDPPLDVIP